jgi:hypothetical protein
MLLIQDRAFLNVYVETCCPILSELNIIAYLAFQAHVRNQAVIGFGVEPWQVARVRVAVGIALANIEQEDKIVPIGERGH